MNKQTCPHLNCLVYHPDGICNCDMKRYCSICKGDKENYIFVEEKELYKDIRERAIKEYKDSILKEISYLPKDTFTRKQIIKIIERL